MREETELGPRVGPSDLLAAAIGGHGLDLRLLVHFVAICESRSLGKAANWLCITQPTLTKSVHSIEAALGSAILTRSSRGVRPTAAGELLLAEARQVLEQMEILVGNLRKVGDVTPRLRLGAVGEALYLMVPDAILALRKELPEAKCDIALATTHDLIGALGRGEIDVAYISPIQHEADDLVVRPLRRNRIELAVAATGVLARRGETTLDSLAGLPFVLLQPHLLSGVRRSFELACAQAGFLPNVIQDVPRYRTALSLVAGGMGVTLVPESVKALAPPGVAFLTIKDAPAYMNTDIMLAWRPGRQSELLRRFIAIAQRIAQQEAPPFDGDMPA